MSPRALLVLLALAAVAVAGCGSRPVAEYPPPPGAPSSPPAPAPEALAGRVVGTTTATGSPSAPARLDRARSTLTLGGRTVRAPRDPIAAAVLGDRVYVVGGRERVLVAYDRRTLDEVARVPAGAGPTDVVAHDGHVYVADTTGQALLVFRTEPELALVHRGALPGAPWALAVDERRDRIWTTIPGRNRVLAFRAETRPERLQGFDTVRQPNDVDVLPGGLVAVTGAERTQLIDPERD